MHYITDENGNLVQDNPTGNLVKTGTIGAATTLTKESSGTCYDLTTSGTDGANVALPALAAGLVYRFVVGAAFATTNWTITATDTVINGNVVVAGAHVAGASEDTVSFVASAESLGDWVELYCNGTNWFVSGSGVTSGSITLSDES